MAFIKKYLTLFLMLAFPPYGLCQAGPVPAAKEKAPDAGATSGKKEYVGVVYFSKIFGQVHSMRSPFSPGLTTISCGHPLKLFQRPDRVPDGWDLVQAGGYEGYVLKKFLTPERPTDCFQGRYQNFFNALELDLTDLYFWGRLYDQYITLKTEVP